jgi:molybdate transport system substrate-binding protein
MGYIVDVSGEEELTVMTRFAGLTSAIAVSVALLPGAQAADAHIAVAANFTDAVKEIGAAWEKKTGHKAVFSFGATGQLFAQISQGAPFDVFLSADHATATKAGAEGHAVASTQYTYAVGKLVLFSKNKDAVKGEQTLTDAKFDKVAIAAPGAAPYGAAAVETMKALGVYEKLQPKFVQGNSIIQAYQFVDTGNAEVGFVALSQVVANKDGSRWLVDAKYYSPIKQDAVLTKKGESSAAAKDFLTFLKGPEAKAVKEKYGYAAE